MLAGFPVGAPREVQTQRFDFPEKGGFVDAELAGGFQPVPSVPSQRAHQECGFQLLEAAGTGGAHCARARREVRQVPEIDLPGAAGYERTFIDVLEFTDISGMVVGHQAREHLVGHAGDFLALEKIESGNKVFNQQRHFLHALAERWNLESHDVDSAVEVIAKLVRWDEFFQLLVGGCV